MINKKYVMTYNLIPHLLSERPMRPPQLVGPSRRPQAIETPARGPKYRLP